jgi:hydrogenase expression/formation protein HypC
MKVMKINGDMGEVEVNGVKREVGLMLIEDIKVGDWVIIHAGFAISKLEKEEARETLALMRKAKIID